MSGSDGIVSVLGGGWSARGYDVTRLPGETIGINDAGLLARTQYIVSMDRLWVENRWDELFRRGMANEFSIAYLRRSALKNITVRPTFLSPFDCDHTSVDFSPRGTSRLNGTNSGACGINLAANLKPKRILLFGFDMNRSPKGEAYFYPPYPWAKPQGATSKGRYTEWAAEFARIAEQFKARGVEVINCSLTSAITAFPKADPKGFLI